MKVTLSRSLLVLVLSLGMFSCSEDEDTIQTTSETLVVDEIFRLVNEHRQEQGLSTLEKSNVADQLAVDHSRYMILQGRISHDNGNSKFLELQEKENARAMGENVASGQNSAQSVMTSWINSTTGHRENIEGNYTHIGIAAVKDENGRYYYTQIFYR